MINFCVWASCGGLLLGAWNVLPIAEPDAFDASAYGAYTIPLVIEGVRLGEAVAPARLGIECGEVGGPPMPDLLTVTLPPAAMPPRSAVITVLSASVSLTSAERST
jgi:hypothetical protein